mgnify:CR=1 FL=1
MKTFLLDGNNFSNMEGFYDEIDKLLTKDVFLIVVNNYSLVCGRINWIT